MTVLRIVADLSCDDPSALATFYHDLLGLKVVIDHGFITTLAAPAPAPVHLSLASEGGSGTPVPTISIEVDDLDAVLALVAERGVTIVYGPVTEPWGVRRFFIRDPAANLLNILCHI